MHVYELSKVGVTIVYFACYTIIFVDKYDIDHLLWTNAMIFAKNLQELSGDSSFAILERS